MNGLHVKELHGKPVTAFHDEEEGPKQCKLARLEGDIRRLQGFKKRAGEKPMIMHETRKDLINPAEKEIRRRLAKLKKGASNQRKAKSKVATTTRNLASKNASSVIIPKIDLNKNAV